MYDLFAKIIEHEGFESKPYPDPLTGAEPYTFGHGLTFLTEQESVAVLQIRIPSIVNELIQAKPFMNEWGDDVSDAAAVVIEMAFQMGVQGCLNFTKMWEALEHKDFARASMEMLDSKWATQTPGRAQEMASVMRALA